MIGAANMLKRTPIRMLKAQIAPLAHTMSRFAAYQILHAKTGSATTLIEDPTALIGHDETLNART